MTGEVRETTAFDKIAEGLREAAAVARGEAEPARVHHRPAHKWTPPAQPTPEMLRAGWLALDKASGCAGIEDEGCSYCERDPVPRDCCRAVVAKVWTAMWEAARAR